MAERLISTIDIDPSMKYMEHDLFSKGRLLAGLMDKIQL